MRPLKFSWDYNKSLINRRKHGVTFEEARSVFYDDRAVEASDPDHSTHEDRFLLLGMSDRLRILVVCNCYREEDGVIRLISARRATQRESRYYEEQI